MSVFDITQFKVDITNGNVADVTSPEGPVEDMYDSFNFPYKFYTDITGTLLNNYVWYYDIECKFDLASTNKDDDWFRAMYDSKSLDNYSEYFDFGSGKTLRIYRGLEDFTGDIWFRIINKSTGEIVHIKKISISGKKQTTDITDVTIFDTEDDVINNNGTSNNTGVTDSTTNNYYQDFDSSYYENLVSSDNFIWYFFNAILFGLPYWLTTPIYLLLSGVVIITLYRMFRGA